MRGVRVDVRAGCTIRSDHDRRGFHRNVSLDFDYRYGIEEEFFLVRPNSARLVARAPRELLQTARRELGPAVSAELLQSQIEIASPILRDAAQARRTMNQLRSSLSDIATRFDLELVAAGTHPLGTWTEQHATPKAHYRQLMEDFQIVARRSVVCGMHVHAEVPPGVDRVQVMNRMLPWLPLFLALSTSSPFWNRQRSGLLSYRQSMYDEWPRTGIPDRFADEAEYDAFAELLKRNGAIADATSLWWGIRPALKFPTLELRITDCCTRLRDTLAIAALYRCAVRLLIRKPDLNAAHTPMTRRVVDENRWRAKRWGLQAEFIREDAAPLPFVDLLAQLRADCADDALALDSVEEIAALDRIVAGGSSAHEQLAIYHRHRAAGAGRAQALEQVVDWLLDTTVSPG